MRKLVYMCIMIIVIAGLFITPACTFIEEAQGQPKVTDEQSSSAVTLSPIPENSSNYGSSPGPDTPTGTCTDSPTISPDPANGNEAIDVITNDEELEAYFNTISDEEIEELFKIIEDIDISPDIGVDKDPGFEDIIIP